MWLRPSKKKKKIITLKHVVNWPVFIILLFVDSLVICRTRCLLCCLTLELLLEADVSHVLHASQSTSQPISTPSTVCSHNHCNLGPNSFHFDWLLSALGTVQSEAGMGMMAFHQVVFQVVCRTLMRVHAVIIPLCYISGPTRTERHQTASSWSRGSILPLWYDLYSTTSCVLLMGV